MSVIPDWYFFVLISLVISVVWIKLIYPKFLTNYFSSALSYQIAHKIYNETGLTGKRVGLTLDIIYLITGALFLYNLFHFFALSPFNLSGIRLLLLSLSALVFFILLRLLLMYLVSILFHQNKIISEFLFHFYLYNKMLGILLIPFLFFIPYTEGILQEVIVYVGIIAVIFVYLFKLVRVILFLLKNVIFIFYLFLYLCVLEIVPFMVIIKFLLSLEQGS